MPSPRPPKGLSSDDLVVAVAPGVLPLASNDAVPAPGDDQTVDAPAVVTSGSARSVLFSLGYTAWTVALTPVWTIPPDALPRESDPAGSMVGVVRDLGSQQGPVEIRASRLPAPTGAGLITEVGAVYHTRFDEYLARLLDTLSESWEPGKEQPQTYSHLIQVALGLLAIEAVRRWRRRPAQKARKSRRSQFFPINGIS